MTPFRAPLAAALSLTLLLGSAWVHGLTLDGRETPMSGRFFIGLAAVSDQAELALDAVPEPTVRLMLSLGRLDPLRAEQLAWKAWRQGLPGAERLLLEIEAHIQRHGVPCLQKDRALDRTTEEPA